LPLVIGLTGGIGAGKSYLAEKLIEKYPVYNSDYWAKILINQDFELKKAIQLNFGLQSYNKDGLDREYLAQVVFNNPKQLSKLNSIVHPAVRRHCDKWCSENQADFVFVEAAILFETGRYKDFDYNILVTASEETRIKRIQERDGLKPTEIKKRFANQWSFEKKKDLADFVFFNENTSFKSELERLYLWLTSVNI
jgi:dephospho-CoA kinase